MLKVSQRKTHTHTCTHSDTQIVQTVHLLHREYKNTCIYEEEEKERTFVRFSKDATRYY